MTELQREHLEADAEDFKIAENHRRRGEAQCDCCGKWFDEDELVRGLCPTCAPRCREEFCDGLLMLEMADLAMCDKCGAIHLLDEKGNWIPRK